MLRHLIAAGLVVILTMAAAPSVDLAACGDKFLRPGRSSRWQSYAAIHPASIILFQSAGAKPDVIKDWQKMLKHAGHKSFVVSAHDDLSQALAGAQYDLVIAAYRDAGRVQAVLQTASAKPGVLPVMSRSTKADVEQAKKEYGYLISADADKYQALIAIDSLMEGRLKTTATIAKR
jgi:hypothetical protein